ncbi:Hypothetical predicted protein [Podarcis lilfordi]|uniref:Uncharacterized protein n=1 Tax=Podarcis lilfordi TaxID=74358 RepID=A0AA35PNA0_9SAUR|nr:Hypothetical predicted protein [Podarcis lilfordi]
MSRKKKRPASSPQVSPQQKSKQSKMDNFVRAQNSEPTTSNRTHSQVLGGEGKRRRTLSFERRHAFSNRFAAEVIHAPNWKPDVFLPLRFFSTSSSSFCWGRGEGGEEKSTAQSSESDCTSSSPPHSLPIYGQRQSASERANALTVQAQAAPPPAPPSPSAFSRYAVGAAGAFGVAVPAPRRREACMKPVGATTYAADAVVHVKLLHKGRRLEL